MPGRRPARRKHARDLGHILDIGRYLRRTEPSRLHVVVPEPGTPREHLTCHLAVYRAPLLRILRPARAGVAEFRLLCGPHPPRAQIKFPQEKLAVAIEGRKRHIHPAGNRRGATAIVGLRHDYVEDIGLRERRQVPRTVHSAAKLAHAPAKHEDVLCERLLDMPGKILEHRKWSPLLETHPFDVLRVNDRIKHRLVDRWRGHRIGAADPAAVGLYSRTRVVGLRQANCPSWKPKRCTPTIRLERPAFCSAATSFVTFVFACSRQTSEWYDTQGQ